MASAALGKEENAQVTEVITLSDEGRSQSAHLKVTCRTWSSRAVGVQISLAGCSLGAHTVKALKFMRRTPGRREMV